MQAERRIREDAVEFPERAAGFELGIEKCVALADRELLRPVEEEEAEG